MRRFISVLSYFLMLIGALNWGLWGFFQFDFIAWLFGGNTTWISRIVYSIIGLAGLWSIGCIGCCCKALCCKKDSCKSDSCKTDHHHHNGEGQ